MKNNTEGQRPDYLSPEAVSRADEMMAGAFGMEPSEIPDEEGPEFLLAANIDPSKFIIAGSSERTGIRKARPEHDIYWVSDRVFYVGLTALSKVVTFGRWVGEKARELK